MLDAIATVLAAPANDTTVNPGLVREQARLAEVAKGHWVGSKFDRSLDVAEIARRVRAEYKAESKDVSSPLYGCTFSVRVRRYSMGRSIDVRVTPAADVPVANLRRMAILAMAQAILNAYNFDRGDRLTDYHHDHFHADVEFEAGVLSAEWEEVASYV